MANSIPYYFSFLLMIFYFNAVENANSQARNEGIALNEIHLNPDSLSDYSFFVSGHFHGSSNNTTGKPAATLLANLNRLNKEDVKFWVSLGDLFLDVKNDIPAYKTLLLDKVKVPVYNVPGNHDKSGGIYEENFGKTYYYFIYMNDLFVFLDTELNDGDIVGEQWKMLQEAMGQIRLVNSVFIFSHRLIWAEEHPDMKHLFTDNTRSSNGNNFRSEILPFIRKKSGSKNVYFMGGSLGAAPSPFFYHNEQNIHYLATAIRDTPKDAFLKVEVTNGKVKLVSFPFIMPVKYYNLKYYNNYNKKDDSFKWRLVPLYIKNMIFHRYFWYGMMMLGIPIFTWWIFRRKKVV